MCILTFIPYKKYKRLCCSPFPTPPLPPLGRTAIAPSPSHKNKYSGNVRRTLSHTHPYTSQHTKSDPNPTPTHPCMKQFVFVLFLGRPSRGRPLLPCAAAAPCTAPTLVRHKCHTLLHPRLRPDGGTSIPNLTLSLLPEFWSQSHPATSARVLVPISPPTRPGDLRAGPTLKRSPVYGPPDVAPPTRLPI
jgi:hypothetical protein